MSATILTTARLRLREFTTDDAAFVVALLNDPDWLRYIGPRGVHDEDDARRWIEEKLVAGYRQNGFGLWAVESRASGEPLGMCGLLRRSSLPAIDLGYAFLPAARGAGLAREAAIATRDHAVRVLGERTVLAITDPDNLRSNRLLEAIGFVLERRAQLEGIEGDTLIYRFTAAVAAPAPLEPSLRFLREVDKLKAVLRQSRLTFDAQRRENDAEHSWHLALMALVLASHAAAPDLDLLRVVRMLLVHDLVEIDAGDTFLYDEVAARTQAAREAAAADRIFGLLDEPLRSELRGAWEEFEARQTPEARFARAVDRAQPILQNLYTEGVSWRSHGVRAADIRARNGAIVSEGAPALWPHLEAMIDEAVRAGHLPE